MNIRTLILTRFAVLLALCLAACGGSPEGSALDPADAPNMLGKADGTGDQADSSCAIVLRSIGRISNNMGGYLDTCQAYGYGTGDCRYIWEGHLDVNPGQTGVGIEVLFKTGMTQGTWYAVDATLEQGTADGFNHYVFRIEEYTPTSGMSYSSLNQTVIDLIPYVKKQNGRLFDHNRISDPLGAYRLDNTNGWTLARDGSCPGAAGSVPEWIFNADFTQTVENGQPQAGGQIKVVYDGRRLRENNPCMGGEGAVSSTTLMVHWLIDGAAGGSAEVEQYMESFGYACQGQSPCITDRDSTPLIDLPIGAKTLAVWFTCTAMGHGDPAGYDSNFGDNYTLALQNGDAPDWAGDFTVKLSRETGDPCEGGVALEQGFSYDTWARQRAAITNVCFDVYKAGVTDFDNPDLWKLLDVQLHYRYRVDGSTTAEYIDSIGRVGNNARYAFDVRELDPFRPNHCPEGTIIPYSQGGEPYVKVDMEFYFTVNGAELRPEVAGSVFVASFIDYQANPYREANCE